MPEEELATVRIFRFDPGIDDVPGYSEFKVPYQNRSVLDVLLYIYQNLDSTFAFRWACSKSFCRACMLSVNGKPVLGCMSPAQKEMNIEPHPKFEIIKDLLVDLDRPNKAPSREAPPIESLQPRFASETMVCQTETMCQLS